MKGNTYCCGDIHGCLDQFNTLLNIIPINLNKDKLILLGDYIDRGPNSKGVIVKIIELQKEYGDNIIPLKGNHEDMCLHYYKEYDNNVGHLGHSWCINGATETVESYPTNDVSKEHREWMKTLRIKYEDEDFYYVHAGFHPFTPIEKQLDYSMMWIRWDFIYSEKDWGKQVVFGHTAQIPSKPLIQYNKIGLDTACVYGYKLTCMRMEDNKIWQVTGYIK